MRVKGTYNTDRYCILNHGNTFNVLLGKSDNKRTAVGKKQRKNKRKKNTLLRKQKKRKEKKKRENSLVMRSAGRGRTYSCIPPQRTRTAVHVHATQNGFCLFSLVLGVMLLVARYDTRYSQTPCGFRLEVVPEIGGISGIRTEYHEPHVHTSTPHCDAEKKLNQQSSNVWPRKTYHPTIT